MTQGSWRWGILGAGAAANGMAAALQAVNGGIQAIASRREETARTLAGRYGIDRVHASPEAMLQDPDLDVIYIASPHDSHHAWMKAAVQAGKHVLCEKAITLNARQLAEVVLLARAQGVVVAEAMTIYHMPLYRRLRALVDSGALGRVRLVQVNFGSWRVLDPQSRFFSRDLAGGALLDIGVYATAFARWFLDSAPHQVLTTVEMAPTGVDDQSGIILKNDRSQLVVMALSLRAKQPKRGVVVCEKGYIEINEYPRADEATVHWTDDARSETIRVGRREDALRYEVADMQHYLDMRQGGGDGVPPSLREAGVETPVPDDEVRQLTLSRDVMSVLTEVRRRGGWGYPGACGRARAPVGRAGGGREVGSVLAWTEPGHCGIYLLTTASGGIRRQIPPRPGSLWLAGRVVEFQHLVCQ